MRFLITQKPGKSMCYKYTISYLDRFALIVQRFSCKCNNITKYALKLFLSKEIFYELNDRPFFFCNSSAHNLLSNIPKRAHYMFFFAFNLCLFFIHFIQRKKAYRGIFTYPSVYIFQFMNCYANLSKFIDEV